MCCGSFQLGNQLRNPGQGICYISSLCLGWYVSASVAVVTSKMVLTHTKAPFSLCTTQFFQAALCAVVWTIVDRTQNKKYSSNSSRRAGGESHSLTNVKLDQGV